ncbi:MAG: hypothetical protein EA412_13395 [Chitinophagaceae bacterium]|nr:MAG: hypothetical protein EA412_13395 [Chitinophagaceae bacterium]
MRNLHFLLIVLFLNSCSQSRDIEIPDPDFSIALPDRMYFNNLKYYKYDREKVDANRERLSFNSFYENKSLPHFRFSFLYDQPGGRALLELKDYNFEENADNGFFEYAFSDTTYVSGHKTNDPLLAFQNGYLSLRNLKMNGSIHFIDDDKNRFQLYEDDAERKKVIELLSDYFKLIDKI